MISYTVVWADDAVQQLASIWLDSPDRNAVTRAAAEIDAQLAVDPKFKGTSVREGLQKLVVTPLVVLFAVPEPDRLVRVEAVRQIAASS